MNDKRVNLVFAIIFLVVGILATSNMIRINSYISETMPRDAAQEQCNTETVKVLRSWVEARISRDSAMDARDVAAQSVLDQLAMGNRPTPEQFAKWRESVTRDREIRASMTDHLKPLPDC